MSRFKKYALPLILLIAALIRVGYFAQLNASPVIFQHREEQTDMYYFDFWAKRIVDGDLLSRDVPHSYAQWHRDLAFQYFREHPGEMGPDPEASARALWERWYGPGVFHQEPLYPYLIAAVYKIFTPDVRWIFALQIILGLVSIWLIFRITRRYFGDQAALIAAGIAAVYGPLVYYELLLLRASLNTLFALLLVDLTGVLFEKKRQPQALYLGLACGFAILLKSTMLLYLAAAGVVIAVRFRRLALTFVTGAVLALAPAVIRNAIVGVPLLSLSSVGPITFISSNAGEFPPELGFFVSEHSVRIMTDAQGKMLPAIIETLKTHPDFWSYFQQLGRKFLAIWHWYEIPNNSNFYYYAIHAPILKGLLTFLLLGPLSLVGIALTWRRAREFWPLLIMGACHVGLLLGFYVLSRFRITFAALLLPFAGTAWVAILQWVRSRDLAKIGFAIGAMIVTLLWIASPLRPEITKIRAMDYVSPYRTGYIEAFTQATNAGEWLKAASILRESLKTEPQEVREIAMGRVPSGPAEAQIASLYRDVHRNIAYALRKAGDDKGAQAEEDFAERLPAR